MNAHMLLFRCAHVAREPSPLRTFAGHNPRIGVSNVEEHRPPERLDAKNSEPKSSTF
jgi:hypothetical protein